MSHDKNEQVVLPAPSLQHIAANAGTRGRLRWKLAEVIEVDERTRELKVHGELVELEHKPFELLSFLLRRPGEVVTREEILAEIWPARVVTDAVVTNCVAKLRLAINDHEQSLIRTVPRFGYRLVGDVRCEPLGEILQPADAQPGLSAGQQVPTRSDWCLVQALGRGGHGEVWLARHVHSDEQRVFKFCTDVEGLQTIKRELTLQKVLLETLGPSDYFVRLLSSNLEEPPFFLEMPYFPHGNLADWLQASGGIAQVPIETRLELLAQCAEAVAMAHSAGVLHKDIKPANILIATQPDGTPSIRLCDFGAGRILEPDLFVLLGFTMRGLTRSPSEDDGTPLYLAPELIAGQPPTMSADIYALGVILYQLVIGDLSRPLAEGWEADVADPLLREDIALAVAGSLRRRMGDAGQLTTRLRSLEARRTAAEIRRKQVVEAELARKQLETWRARRTLVFVLAAVLLLSIVVAAALSKELRDLRARCAKVLSLSEAPATVYYNAGHNKS